MNLIRINLVILLCPPSTHVSVISVVCKIFINKKPIILLAQCLEIFLKIFFAIMFSFKKKGKGEKNLFCRGI